MISPERPKQQFEGTSRNARAWALFLTFVLSVCFAVMYADEYWIPTPPEPPKTEKRSVYKFSHPTATGIPWEAFEGLELTDEDFRMLYGGTTTLYGLSIDTNRNDPDSWESAIHVGPGWDCMIATDTHCLTLLEDGSLFVMEVPKK